MAVRVGLASGEFFFVDAPLDAVVAVLDTPSHCVRVGNRRVNPAAVTQLEFVLEVSTIFIPEQLNHQKEAEDGRR